MSRTKSAEKPSLVNIEDFKYLNNLLVPYPQLALGIRVPREAFRDDEYPIRNYSFKPGRDWKRIAHQTAGLRCNQHYFICTFLTPKSANVFDSCQVVADKWYGTNAGIGGMGLDTIIQYRNHLKSTLNVDCNLSWKLFEEGIYPIDSEFAQFLTSDSIPKDLDDLINFKSGMERAAGCIGRWSLVILGKNSD